MKNYIIILSLFVLTLISYTNQVTSAEPYKVSEVNSANLEQLQYNTLEVVFVKDMANRGLSFLSDSSISLPQRKNAFRKLFSESFDIKTLARFSIGVYWRSMSDNQKKAYFEAFEDYTVNIYSRRFQDYNGQQLEFINKTKNIGNDVIVSSLLIQKSGEKIAIDWRVTNKEGQYKIIDIVVNGVSMAVTQRSDFSSTIQRGGGKVEVLLEKLKTQNTK